MSVWNFDVRMLNKTFFAGNDVVLPCKFVGNPKPSQIWINPHGKVIEHDEKYSILPEGGLRIRNIEWSDMGEYICSVENSVGVDSVETFLYPMKVSNLLINEFLLEDQFLTV